MLFCFLAHSTFDSKIASSFDSKSEFDSDAYFAVAPPETPISLRFSLRVSLRVCIVMFFPEI